MVALIAVALLGVEVPDHMRVKNSSGYCMWACLDTAARVNESQGLVGVLTRRKLWIGYKHAFDDEIEKELIKCNASYLITYQLSNDRSLLEQYTSTHGVIVSFKIGTPVLGCHAVLVTEYNDKVVRFYDPNKIEKIWTCSRLWFDAYWLGGSIVILPDK